MLRVRTQLGLTDAYLASTREKVLLEGRHFQEGRTKEYASRNVGIAVLDSGVYPHPDLSDGILAFQDFIGRYPSMQSGKQGTNPYDDYGHGTHVCGILCGDGRLSGGKFRGIFPEGKLIVGKVLDQRGDGRAEDMLEGMKWVFRQKDRYGIRLLNISVGISGLQEGEKLRNLQGMLLKLSKAGILVVCAAGNRGPNAGTLSALGEMPEVISVGCHDGAFYGKDPRRCDRYCGRGKERSVPRKPDIVAPGTCIVSCSARRQTGLPGKAYYEERSGTSMAAPIVTGCLARAIWMKPTITPERLKWILTKTAKDMGEPWNKQGWGMVQPRRMEELLLEEEGDPKW